MAYVIAPSIPTRFQNMKVRCLTQAVPKSASHFPGDGVGEYRYHLTPNEWYTVYGISTINGVPTYLIHEDVDLDYPMFVPAACFGETSGVLPAGFVVNRYEGRSHWTFSVVAPAFRDSPTFYDRLTDGDPDAVAQWRAFRADVDAQEPVPEPVEELDLPEWFR